MALILVVEDEHNIRKLITSILRQIGYDVRSANNGVEALGVLQYSVPDVLLTDLNMPQMTGHELIMATRRDFPNLPIIAVSAYTEVVRPSLKINRVRPLPKPFTSWDLVNTVNQAIANPIC
jgi:chemosensory pili system protein ChpA (sensor histidine kinase/response regulator)